MTAPRGNVRVSVEWLAVRLSAAAVEIGPAESRFASVWHL